MGKIETPPLTVDQYTQDMLAILIDTTARLAEEVEKQLPHELCTEYDLVHKHSKTPWMTLYWAILMQDERLDGAVRKLLSLRATLEDVGTQLHTVIHDLAGTSHSSAPAPKRDSHNL